MPTAIAVISAVATVAGTAVSLNRQRKAAQKQERQQTLATRRSRRQAIRRAQIQRAQATASAQASGSLNSSGAQGGIGSLTSQLGEQLGFSSMMSGLSNEISTLQTQAANASGFAQLGGLGLNVFGVPEINWDNIKPTSPAAAQSSGPRTRPNNNPNF